MRRDLANARMGQLVGADGRTYSLQATRIEPAEVEALIEAGCPVVTYLPGGRLLCTTRTTRGPPGPTPGARRRR